VVILIKDIEELEEPRDAVFTKDRLEEFKVPDIMEKCIKSFAPQIKGGLHASIKESLILSAVTGTRGLQKRHHINVEMIGNKSRGKTELQKAYAALTGGSVIVGYSATKAGLGTGTVKLQDGTSIPKPGAHVTHNGKSLCVDEQDKMHGDDLKALYECMEDMTISAVKANMIGEEHLPADTAIVGGANFKFGDYDPDQGVRGNIPDVLTDALISRFALVWRILDYDEYTQTNIADSLLGLSESDIPPFDERTLRLFINSVKHSKPGISREAKITLKDFYLQLSKKKSKEDMPMEPRQLLDLVNMTTARAKILQKPEADKSDAEATIALFKKQLESWGEGISSIQATLISEEQSKDQLLSALVNASKDDNGHFSRESVLDRWEKTKWFKDRRAAAEHFDRMGYLMARSGKYYETPS